MQNVQSLHLFTSFLLVSLGYVRTPNAFAHMF